MSAPALQGLKIHGTAPRPAPRSEPRGTLPAPSSSSPSPDCTRSNEAGEPKDHSLGNTIGSVFLVFPGGPSRDRIAQEMWLRCCASCRGRDTTHAWRGGRSSPSHLSGLLGSPCQEMRSRWAATSEQRGMFARVQARPSLAVSP